MKTQCTGQSDAIDAGSAISRLNRQVDHLSQLFITYMQQAPLERAQRNFNAVGLAEVAARIVGGVPVKQGMFPECCLVGHRYANGTFTWFCSGVLVNSRTVLTAAHCQGNPPINVVALNATDQNDLGEAEIQGVRWVSVHPEHGKNLGHDLAVLVLKDEAQTPPAQLATTDEIGQALKTLIVGFGNHDKQSSRGFGVKRRVEVDLMAVRRTPQDNLEEEETFYRFESERELVAGGEGFDSVNGDSGGPLFIKVGECYKVAALGSRATLYEEGQPGLVFGHGGIATRLDAQLGFVNQVLAERKLPQL